MKLGISSYSFPWAIGVRGFPKPRKPISIFDIIDFAAKQNLSIVQFADNLPLYTLDLLELKKVKKYSNSKNISIEIGAKGSNIDLLNKCIDCAEILGANIIRILLPEENIERIISNLGKVEKRLQEHNIKIAIENYEAFSLKDYKYILETLDSGSYGLCFDTFNSLLRGESINDYISTLFDKIINLHVKDVFCSRTSSNMGIVIEGCSIGNGILNIGEIIEIFKQKDVNFSVIIEQWSSFHGNIELTIEKELSYVLQGIETLKKLI